MAAKAAQDQLELSLAEIRQLQRRQESGLLPVDTLEDVSTILITLRAVSRRFLDAVATVNRSGLGDLLQVNEEEMVEAHTQAYDQCEQAAALDGSLIEVAMAVAAAGAHYTKVTEERPLHPIQSDQDWPFELPIQPTLLPVSGIRHVRGKRPAPPISEEAKRQKQTEPRRSARLAKAPKTNAPDTQPSRMASTRLNTKELQRVTRRTIAHSKQRAKEGARPDGLTHTESTGEVAVSALTLHQNEWLHWAHTLLDDPATLVLDRLAAVSSAVAADYSQITGAMLAPLFTRMYQRFVVEVPPFDQLPPGTTVSGQLSAMSGLSGAALVRSFARLLEGGLGQQLSQVAGKLVEVFYHFLILFTPVQFRALPQRQRTVWFQFLQRWSPFLSLALALVLVISRHQAAVWIVSGTVQRLSDGSLQLAADTPGSLVVSLATSWLPEDSTALRLLQSFYRFASDGISTLQSPSLSGTVGQTVVELMGGLTGLTASSALVDWTLGFFSFLSNLHRLQFAAPLLHVFSLIELGAKSLAHAWQWAGQQLKQLLRPDSRLHGYIDMVLELVDLAVLMVSFLSQMIRYHGLLLLLLAVFQALLVHGVGGAGAVLEAPPLFGGS